MKAVAHHELTETLSALEALHEAECVVLTKLDRAALDSITEQKLALCERLEALAAEQPPRAEASRQPRAHPAPGVQESPAGDARP